MVAALQRRIAAARAAVVLDTRAVPANFANSD